MSATPTERSPIANPRDWSLGLPGRGTFARGVHPADGKSLSAGAAVEVLPTPAEVAIPLLQHIGAPCAAKVKAKEQVSLGQCVGEAEAFVSAPVHASVAGVVQREGVTTLPNGRHVRTVPIKSAGDQLAGRALWDAVYGGDWPTGGLDGREPAGIAEAAYEAGIVGMGGAGFPTHVKLRRLPKKPIDTILINGCECEPYLTSDYRLMLEAPRAIIAGALLEGRALGVSRIVAAIEDNKPDAVAAMREAASGTAVQVAELHTKYPMGGERCTIQAVLDRKVPTGGLPLDVGVVVSNVASAAAVAGAVLRGRAVTHRIVAVTGAGVRQAKNLLVPVGVTYGELIDYCGGLTADAARVLAGGPMMGFALGALDARVTKGTSGVTVLTEADVRRAAETNCIRCGRCVDACPLRLVPTRLALASRHRDWGLARRYHLTACVECGCCGYVCPAAIPLVQLIRTGKALLPRA